ncbi:MAG TPA: hypothetical protein VFI69_07715 [Candidatus Limnocylindrales bacterium]|jgi:hypothetical protein|nr:hypothetical protein [Candidatus Limnocylindrales bacterium]
MTEPADTDVPRREFPEARPPHLPDVLSGSSLWAWLFVLAALVVVVLAWPTSVSSDPSVVPSVFASNLLLRVGPIASCLFGAALFFRHPDARRTVPLLVFGAALFAASALLSIASAGLSRFLDGLFPATEQMTISPAVIALSVFQSLVATFAVLYTGAGLTAARRSTTTSAFRPLVVWLSVVAILSVVLSAVSGLRDGAGDSTSALILGAVGFVLSVVSSLAWTYLLAVAIDGWLAGERPRAAWGLVAIGAALHLGIGLIIGLFTVFAGSGSGSEPILVLISIASALVWLALLLAFALGLPAAAATPDRPEATPPGSAAG